MHKFGQLFDRIIKSNITPVNYVDSIRLGVTDLVPHKTAKTGQIGRDRRYAHDGTFGRGVPPGLVVAGEDT